MEQWASEAATQILTVVETQNIWALEPHPHFHPLSRLVVIPVSVAIESAVEGLWAEIVRLPKDNISSWEAVLIELNLRYRAGVVRIIQINRADFDNLVGNVRDNGVGLLLATRPKLILPRVLKPDLGSGFPSATAALPTDPTFQFSQIYVSKVIYGFALTMWTQCRSQSDAAGGAGPTNPPFPYYATGSVTIPASYTDPVTGTKYKPIELFEA